MIDRPIATAIWAPALCLWRAVASRGSHPARQDKVSLQSLPNRRIE
jgi:hypothetical protein